MIFYLDTSALVKLYTRELHSGDVRRWVRDADTVATSVVSYAETRAAFARARRESLSSDIEHRRRISQFNRDWAELLRVELTTLVGRNAGELAELHALRGFDAIHLASALWLRDKTDDTFFFGAFDQRLCEGAAAAGLQVAV